MFILVQLLTLSNDSDRTASARGLNLNEPEIQKNMHRIESRINRTEMYDCEYEPVL